MLADSINPNNQVESINEAVEFAQEEEGEEEDAQKAGGEVVEDSQKEAVVHSIPLKNQQYPTLQNHSNQSLQVVSTLINYLNH